MVEKFTEKLRVNKDIVSLLSKSTYQRSFPSALREIVSNAYDADALSVNINFDRTLSVIEIHDDGNGMTKNEFRTYLTLAGSIQKSDLTRKYKRKRIGQFGVGFLSIFPFCETIEIVTTSENSADVLKASIPAKDYFKNKDPEKGSGKISNEKFNGEALLDSIPIFGEINSVPQQKLDHYTTIKLISPSHIAKQYFSKSVSEKTSSIQSYNSKERLIWELEEDLPISLNKKSKYYEHYKYSEPIGITVVVNGQELMRHDYLKNVLVEGEVAFDNISCKYILTTNNKSIKPEEARGIKIRVNNVGVGPRTDFQLRRSRGFPRLHFITGEIFFSENIKVHLNLSRDGFISNPVTDEIEEYFSEILRSAAAEVQQVAEAENIIADKRNVRTSNATKSQAEIISSNIKKLTNRGYKLIEVDNAKEDIVLDKAKKHIYLTKNALEENEIVKVLGRNITLEYDKWSIDDPFPACRFIGRNKIQINQNFPLFKSKSLGSVFRKIYLLLLVGVEKTNSSKQLYELFNDNLLKEFQDFLKP